MTPTPALTAEQSAAIESMRQWHQRRDGQPFRLFGPAGTGKTTLAQAIPAALGCAAQYMAYSNKAAHVLRGKGVSPVATIHSTIYFPPCDEEAKRQLAAARALLAPFADDALARMLRGVVAKLEAASKRPAWEWNPEAFDENRPGVLVLDEVSMVDRALAEDIERYRIPVIVLGDPAQLPPVDGAGHYTGMAADFTLTEIHRQALDSPALATATRVRLSTGRGLGLTPADKVRWSLRDAMEHEQTIVWSNKRRWAIVNAWRRAEGRIPGSPSAGDRVVCLANNRALGVHNGAAYEVLAAQQGKGGPTLRVRDEEGSERVISVFAEGFLGWENERAAKARRVGVRGSRMLATFAQAVTCHKAQGSQYASVYVVDELSTMMWVVDKNEGPAAAQAQARSWLYTACTRTKGRLTIGTPDKGAIS